MKKLTAILLAFVLLTTNVLCAFEADVSARGAAVFDTLTGEFLFEKNADEILPMASTTKIMTALMAVELLDIEKEYEILPEWTGIEGSSIYLKAGEVLTARDLLYGLMLNSGNDAAHAIACIIAETEEDFVKLMNERAQIMGLKNTSFESASGLDGERHHTTARELALITATAMKNANFREIVGTKYYTCDSRSMKNHNKLLFSLDGACGVKTGFTKKSGRCLVSAVERDNRTIIAVTLNAPNDWDDHTQLMEKAFKGCAPRTLISDGYYGYVPVIGGEKKIAPLYIKDSVSLNLSEEELNNIEIKTIAPRFVYAPVIKDGVYGALDISIKGKSIYQTDIFYFKDVNQEYVKRNSFTEFFDKIKAFFSERD